MFGLTQIVRYFVGGSGGNDLETAVSLLAFVCYWSAGYFAVDVEDGLPAASGALAGVGVALLGLVTSVVEWAVLGGGTFLRGAQATHPVVALLGPWVFGAVLGAIGGVSAGQRRLPGRSLVTSASTHDCHRSAMGSTATPRVSWMTPADDDVLLAAETLAARNKLIDAVQVAAVLQRLGVIADVDWVGDVLEAFAVEQPPRLIRQAGVVGDGAGELVVYFVRPSPPGDRT